MATYIISDVHGCFDELQALLKKINFTSTDYLIFVGDLINRGPKSLATLRFVKELQEKNLAATVLGNHDLALIAAAAGNKKLKNKDNFPEILQAEDASTLIKWLRHQPLTYKTKNAFIVHAGIPPQWSIAQAQTYAQQAEHLLQSDDWQKFAKTQMLGNQPEAWDDNNPGIDRIRYTINALTRMRYCDSQGTLDLKLKVAPKNNLSKKYLPWFQHKNSKRNKIPIFFGHWASLGALEENLAHSTDTGCIWGGKLTAYELERNLRHTYTCSKSKLTKLKETLDKCLKKF